MIVAVPVPRASTVMGICCPHEVNVILAGITVATATELESTLAVKYAFSPSLLPVRLHPFLPSSFLALRT